MATTCMDVTQTQRVQVKVEPVSVLGAPHVRVSVGDECDELSLDDAARLAGELGSAPQDRPCDVRIGLGVFVISGADARTLATMVRGVLWGGDSRPPTVVLPDGTREWYAEGRLHRLDGPAFEHPSGYREWWVDGRQHRLDGPAVEHASGSREWWVDDRRHRLDGPAIEYVDGYREWRVENRLHRTDGPAVEYANGSREWWVNDEFVASAGPGEPHPPHAPGRSTP